MLGKRLRLHVARLERARTMQERERETAYEARSRCAIRRRLDSTDRRRHDREDGEKEKLLLLFYFLCSLSTSSCWLRNLGSRERQSDDSLYAEIWSEGEKYVCTSGAPGLVLLERINAGDHQQGLVFLLRPGLEVFIGVYLI